MLSLSLSENVNFCNAIDGWMDVLRFYAPFNSISVISGRCIDENEGLWQWNSVYGSEDFTSSEDRTRSARSSASPTELPGLMIFWLVGWFWV